MWISQSLCCSSEKEVRSTRFSTSNRANSARETCAREARFFRNNCTFQRRKSPRWDPVHCLEQLSESRRLRTKRANQIGVQGGRPYRELGGAQLIKASKPTCPLWALSWR